MTFALNLSEDSHILSAWKVLPNGVYKDMPIVEALPEGDVTEYRYTDGEFIHDPLPESEQPETEPSIDEVLNALLGV